MEDVVSVPRPARRSARAAAKPVVVKSAARTLAILEHFDRCRASQSVGEIADALQLPQSSTSALLRSMVAVGYLTYAPYGRRYAPSQRVPVLGSWVSSRLVSEGLVPRLARALADRLGCTAMLMMRLGDHAQCIHVVNGSGGATGTIAPGGCMPLVASAPGHVLLSNLDDEHIRRLVRRINAHASPEAIVAAQHVVSSVTGVRQRGYALSCGDADGVLAGQVPSQPKEEPLVLALAGPADALREAVPALLAMLGRIRRDWPRNVTSLPTWPGLPAAATDPAPRSEMRA
jgi:DNA-binding IclR family transcriptional regulator